MTLAETIRRRTSIVQSLDTHLEIDRISRSGSVDFFLEMAMTQLADDIAGGVQERMPGYHVQTSVVDKNGLPWVSVSVGTTENPKDAFAHFTCDPGVPSDQAITSIVLHAKAKAPK